MEHHQDRRVVLSTESEFQNLYSWSLQEIKEDGTKDGRDQIPWEWTLYFTATALTLSDTFAVEESYRDAETEPSVRQRQSIAAKLTPGSTWGRGRYTSYSMLGTARKISEFSLSIEPLSEGMERETCKAWGSVSYTSEIDFRDDTTDDTVIFYLCVSAETFALYAQKIAARQIDDAVLRVGGVDGFYSDWSPSISTYDVKVLTAYKEHAVEIAPGCEIVPPRLGRVREAELYLRRKCSLDPEPDGDAEDQWSADEDPTVSEDRPHSVAARRTAVAHAQLMKMLGSLRVAAWVIAALLVLIVMK